MVKDNRSLKYTGDTHITRAQESTRETVHSDRVQESTGETVLYIVMEYMSP